MKAVLSLVLAAGAALSVRASRTVEDFNDGWEFSQDQKTWRSVDVPHDWAIESAFDPKGEVGSGALPWKGVGYYRKNLVLAEVPKGKRVFLDFDGIMCDGTVFVNDQSCGRQQYGYLGLTADATPYLFAGTNTIVVKADTTKLASRWYPGAGLYRRVRKIETGDLYVDPRDVAISTPVVTSDTAKMVVKGSVINRRLSDLKAEVSVTVLSPGGENVAEGVHSNLYVPKGGTRDFTFTPKVFDPELWQMEDNPKLYTTVITVRDETGVETDRVSFRTGIRSFRFDADKGFFLNGERVQLKGVCLHSDLGILGMAFNKSAMRRQFRLLKDMGVNALRTSHNPPAPELLDLCDEMGIFVWDECFDKWNATCGRGDEPLESYVESHLREFVCRDRNHPAVFVWSIGNEIPPGGGFAPGQEIWNMPWTIGTTAERCTRFRAAVLAEDRTRPVGIGSCFPDAGPKGHYANLDITGWNYSGKYDKMKALHPDKPVLYSESASAFSDYGYYAERLPTNKTDYAVKDVAIDSYDRNAAAWSDIPDREFERMERDAYCGGEFVWTGIDYLGEPSPYASEKMREGWTIATEDRARSSYFGIFDLLVFPKDRVYLYRSHWNTKDFTLHLVPDHWTFPERVGKVTPVYVYTSADEAELFVNGVSQGRRRKDRTATMADGYYANLPRYRLMWNEVVYQPGEVKVVAYGTDGETLGTEVLRTAGAAERVVLTPESSELPAEKDELVFVKVTLADRDGNAVPRDNRRVSFRVEGPAKIVSVGNSNPRGRESFKATDSHLLHNGRAGLALTRTGPGKVSLVAEADGLRAACATFEDKR